MVTGGPHLGIMGIRGSVVREDRTLHHSEVCFSSVMGWQGRDASACVLQQQTLR